MCLKSLKAKLETMHCPKQSNLDKDSAGKTKAQSNKKKLARAVTSSPLVAPTHTRAVISEPRGCRAFSSCDFERNL